MADTDLANAAAEATESLEPVAAERGVRLVARGRPGAGPRRRGAAPPAGGDPRRQRDPPLPGGQPRDGGRRARRVADRRGRGPGIDPAHLDQVFERFWRAPDAPNGGTGSASRSRAGSPSATAARSRPPTGRRRARRAVHGPPPRRLTTDARATLPAMPPRSPIARRAWSARPTARRSRCSPRDPGPRSSSSTARPPTTGRGGSSGRCSRGGTRSTPIDRRGRGDSGDGAGRTRSGSSWTTSPPWPTRSPRRPVGPVDVLGHSLGGRIALGASLRTRSIRRVIAYESAPGPRCARRASATSSSRRSAPISPAATTTRSSPGS